MSEDKGFGAGKTSNRRIDRIGDQAYRAVGKRFSLVPDKRIATWKSLSIIAFFSGLMAASVWFAAYHLEQDTLVIDTKMFSAAKDKGDEKPEKGGIVGRADDRILMKFKKDATADKRQAILDKQGLKEKSEIKEIGVKVVAIPAGKVPEDVVKKLLEDDQSNVEYAEVDALVAPDSMPNDPSVASEWHIAKIGAAAAWESGQGAGVTIAILDSGVECTHPDLAANCVSGWNVVSNNATTTPVNPHGTRVAGTAAAVGNNSLQMAGVAYAAKIMPIRITNDSTGYAYWSSVASGVTWAADHGAKVVNNSYGSHVSSSVQSAAAYLNSKGGLMFNSAMNDGAAMTQANPTSIVTVSATDGNDVKASWSNYGTPVDLAAPGVSVMCTNTGGGLTSCSGTSFAAPVTAATAALLWSVKPSLSPSQVENILKSTAVDLGASGRDDLYGYGRVDAAAAVAAALGSSAPVPDTTAPAAPTNLTATTATSVALTWGAATDNVGVTGYSILRNGAALATSTQTSYMDTAVTAGSTYTYTTKATDAAGNISPESNSVSVTVPAGTAALTITSVSGIGKTGTTGAVTWTTNLASTGVVKYGTSQNALTSTISDPVSGVTHTANITGLTKKTRYYYQVVATGPNGETVTSAVQNFMTKPK